MAVELVQGELFQDHRGKIASLNNFCFDGVKRSYFITHPDISVIRGWNGHKLERKWFCCLKGSFTLALIEIDNWEKPSPELKPEIFKLSDSVSQIICVPCGYASCIKADSPDSVLMVLSDKTMAEAAALNDSYRYDADYFFKWSDLA